MEKKTVALLLAALGGLAVFSVFVLAVLGGALFATFQEQCTRTVGGFTGDAVAIAGQDDIGITEEEVQFRLTNVHGSDVTVRGIEVMDQSGNVVASEKVDQSLAPGSEHVFMLDDMHGSDSCNSYEVVITYDSGPATGQEATGTVMGRFSAK